MQRGMVSGGEGTGRLRAAPGPTWVGQPLEQRVLWVAGQAGVHDTGAERLQLLCTGTAGRGQRC